MQEDIVASTLLSYGKAPTEKMHFLSRQELDSSPPLPLSPIWFPYHR